MTLLKGGVNYFRLVMTNYMADLFILGIWLATTNLYSYNLHNREEFMLKRLSELNIGETGQVMKVEGEGKVKRRLFDMGVTPGTSVYLRKKAPLGDP